MFQVTKNMPGKSARFQVDSDDNGPFTGYSVKICA